VPHILGKKKVDFGHGSPAGLRRSLLHPHSLPGLPGSLLILALSLAYVDHHGAFR
jgi:hypothetical protein